MKKETIALLTFICVIFSNLFSQTITTQTVINGKVREIVKTPFGTSYDYDAGELTGNTMTTIGKIYQGGQSRLYVEWDISSLKLIKNAKIEMYYNGNADIANITVGGIFSINRTSKQIVFGSNEETWNDLQTNAENIYKITLENDNIFRLISIQENTKVKKTTNPDTYYTLAEYIMKLANSGTGTLCISMINSSESSNGLQFEYGSNAQFKLTYELLIPNSPANFSVSNLTTSSFTLNWNPSAGATGYYISLNGGSKIYTASNSYKFSTLNPNTTCNLLISAVNTAGESGQTPYTVTTPPLLTPTNFTMNNLSCSSFKLSWNAVNYVSGYKIYCNGAESSILTTNSTIISGLGVGTYNFTVCSINENGNESMQTSPLSVIRNINVPIAPTITLSREEDHLIYWNAVNYATSYKFYVYRSVPSLKLVNTFETTNIFIYFDPSYVGSYVFKVKALNGTCESDFSNSIIMTLGGGIEKRASAELEQNISDESLVIYPNPATKEIIIKGITTFNFTIFDVTGRKVKEGDNLSGSIDISSLDLGIYSLKIESNGTIYFKKFIKQ